MTMSADILYRTILSVGIAASILVLYWLVNRYVLARASRRRTTGGSMPGLDGAASGIPLLLYFTTPDCAPCKTVQRPAIERVWQLLGDCLQVIEVDASDQPDIASHWGVLSVPTTFIIDSNGKPRHVNHGVATTDKLLKQLETL